MASTAYSKEGEAIESLGGSAADGAFGRAVVLAGGKGTRLGPFTTIIPKPLLPLGNRAILDVVVHHEELARNQDDELNHRIRLAGGRLVCTPRVCSSYRVRSSFTAQWRQYSDYGKFRLLTIEKHGRAGAWHQLAAPALVAGLAAAVGVEAATRGRVPLGRVTAGGYALGLGLAGARVATGAGAPRLAPHVSTALATMHLAYGSGFWAEGAHRLAAVATGSRP